MLARLATALVAGSLLAAVSSPAPAHAADPIIAHDTMIQYIWALDGDLVYVRREFGKPLPERVWMARFRGRLHRARGIPRGAGVGDIGRDAKGRKVLTFAVFRYKDGNFVSAKWFLYDLARNRARPLRGLPTKCAVGWVSVWRNSMAYTAQCKGDQDSAVYVRQGKRTRRLAPDPTAGGFTYRAGTLAVVIDTGLDNLYVKQWMANGKSCSRDIDVSNGDATEDAGWYPTDLWIANGYVIWTMGAFQLRPDFAILAAKVAPGCKTPGPVGLFPFRPETKTLRTVVVDQRRVFYADDTTLRRHALSAKPSFDPPRNDDFNDAQLLSQGPPFSLTGRVAYATVQPGEPLAKTKHTVWYAYRPTQSGTVYVTVSPACRTPPNNCGGLPRFGVYTGTSPGTLTEIPQSGGPYSSRYTRVDAVAGHTYWISVGSPLPEPNYERFTLFVEASPPG
jgi:hypothetical protein